MQIRKANKSDYEKLMKLYNLFVGENRYSNHDKDSFNKVINNPKSFIFLAEDKGNLIGFATFSLRDVVRFPKPIAELDEMYVLDKYQQKGIGKQLMKTIEDKARELSCYRIYIESSYDRQSAHKFYEALGYTNFGYHYAKDL